MGRVAELPGLGISSPVAWGVGPLLLLVGATLGCAGWSCGRATDHVDTILVDSIAEFIDGHLSATRILEDGRLCGGTREKEKQAAYALLIKAAGGKKLKEEPRHLKPVDPREPSTAIDNMATKDEKL